MVIRKVIYAGVSVAALACGTAVSAQQLRLDAPVDPTSHVSITVVLDTNGPRPAILNASPGQHVVFLQPNNLTREAISRAIFAVLIHAQQNNDRGTHFAAVDISTVEPFVAFPWSGMLLARLENAQPMPVPKVGERRALRIWVSRLRLRAR